MSSYGFFIILTIDAKMHVPFSGYVTILTLHIYKKASCHCNLYGNTHSPGLQLVIHATRTVNGDRPFTCQISWLILTL